MENDPLVEMYRILAANDSDQSINAGKMFGGILFALYSSIRKTRSEEDAIKLACLICVVYANEYRKSQETGGKDGTEVEKQ